MMLHSSQLYAASGGVEVFLIGADMCGLTTIRARAPHPAGQAFRDLRPTCAPILGAGTAISYADARHQGCSAGPGGQRPAARRAAVLGAVAGRGIRRARNGVARPAATDRPHRPSAAAHAVPWPGEIAVFPSPSTRGFDLLTKFGSRSRIGALVSGFFQGPTSRFDLDNALIVDLLTSTLESVDLMLFDGAPMRSPSRERPRRLGDRAGRRGGADRAGPVSPDPASPRPARHGRRHGQSATCGRAGGGRSRTSPAALRHVGCRMIFIRDVPSLAS